MPKSIVGPFSDNGTVMGVIFIAVAFGVALRSLRHHEVRTVEDLVHVALTSLITILHWIIDLVPLAVFGIVASIVGVKGFGDFLALGGFVVAVLAGADAASRLLPHSRAARFLGAPARTAARHARRAGDGVFDRQLDRHDAGDLRAACAKMSGCARNRPAWARSWARISTTTARRSMKRCRRLFVAQLLGHASDAQPAVHRRGDVGRRLGRRGRHSRSGSGDDDAGLQGRGLPTDYIAMLLTVDWFLDRCRTAINVMGDVTSAVCWMARRASGRRRDRPEASETPQETRKNSPHRPFPPTLAA